ncbi:MAG TPA: hypothetical protein VF216_09730 [Mizugakiibacter sp.]
MPKALFRLALVAMVAAGLLAACGKQPASPTADTRTPDGAVLTATRLLKAGDFDGLAQATLPPQDYQAQRADWEREHLAVADITDEDRRKFASAMQRLTAPGAEQQLFAQLKPQLAAFEQQYKDQLPTMIGIGQTMLGTAVDQSADLTAAQKAQAKEALVALAQWAQGVAWTDPAKAQQAIAVICDTARKLDLKTLDQARALPYEQAVQKYGLAWQGFKRLTAVYGLDIDQALDSAKVETLSNDGQTARLKVTYTLLGKPISGETTMVQRDGRWYDRDALEARAKARAAETAAASSAAPPAPAAIAPAAPAGKPSAQ